MLVFGQAYLAADERGLDTKTQAFWQHERSLLIMPVGRLPILLRSVDCGIYILR